MSQTVDLVSVIICHHKGELVLKAIRSVVCSLGVKTHIIVATSDKEKSFHNVDTIFIPGGPARKRNVATRFAKSEYIAYFDDDVEITTTCIYEMLEVLKKEGVGMVFGKTLNMEFRDMFDEAGSFLTPTGFLWARGDRTKDIGQFEEVEPILAGKSASCMIKKSVLMDAGLFDESYGILGEESDLAWRVWLKGYKVMYVPKSVAYHAFNTRFKPVDFYTAERVYFNGCRNYLAMLTTNLGSKNLPFALLCQLLAWTTSSLGMAIRGRFQASFYILKGLFYYFSNLPYHIRKRMKVQKGRKIAEDELMAIVLREPNLSYYVRRFFRYIRLGLHG